MSDNPNENELIHLGVETDDSSFDAYRAQIDAIQQSLTGLDQTIERIAANDTLKQNLDAVTSSMEQLDQAIAGVDQRMKDLAQTQQQSSQWQGYLAPGGDMNAYMKGYGVSGGMIGPEEAGDDGGGGGGGSMFGVAHGIRAASGLGRLAGLGPEATNAFTGGADVLYLITGLKQVTKMFGGLSEALETSGGLFPPLTNALMAMNVPMAGLLATVGPVAIALVALGMAIGQFNQIIEDGQKKIQSATEAQEKFFEFAATATTQDAQKRIEHDKNVQGANDQEINAIQDKIKSIYKGLNAEHGYTFSDADIAKSMSDKSVLGGTPLTESVGIQSLLDDLKKFQDASAAAGTDMDAMTNGIKQGAFAANDYAKQQKTQTERSIADIQSRTSAENSANKDIANGSSDAVKQKLDAWGRDYKANEEAIAQLKATGDTSEATTGKIQQLEDANRDLAIQTATYVQMGVLPEIQAREADIQAAKDLAKAIKEEASQAQKTANDIDKMTQMKADFDDQTAKIAEQRFIKDSRADSDFALKQSQQVADFHTKQAQEEEDHARDRANKIAKYTADMSDIENKSRQKRLDDIDQFNEENAQKAVEYNRKIQQINSQSHDTILEAAARLDARAVLQEEKKRNQQVEQATQSYEDEKAKRQKALDQKLADIDTNTKAEEDKRISAFNTELKQYDDQYATKRQREQQAFNLQQQREDAAHTLADNRRREDYALQDKERTNAFTRQIQDIIKHNTSLIGLQNTSQAAILDSASSFWATMRNLASSATTIAAGSHPTVSQAQSLGLTSQFKPQTIASHGFALGTSGVPEDDVFNLHKGEIVGSPFVGDVARSFLGSNFTQQQLAGAIAAGAGGGSNGGFSWSGDVNINGPIGQVNPNDLRNAMKAAAGEAMQETFKEYSQKTWRH